MLCKGYVWFETTTCVKEGSLQIFLTACPDVRQRESRRDEALKLSAVKYQKQNLITLSLIKLCIPQCSPKRLRLLRLLLICFLSSTS